MINLWILLLFFFLAEGEIHQNSEKQYEGSKRKPDTKPSEDKRERERERGQTTTSTLISSVIPIRLRNIIGKKKLMNNNTLVIKRINFLELIMFIFKRKIPRRK